MNKPFKLEFDKKYSMNISDIITYDGESNYVVYKQHWLNHIKRLFRFLPIKFKYKYYLKDAAKRKI